MATTLTPQNLPGQAHPAQPTLRELCGYCAGAIGSNVNYALVSTYLIVFYTEVAGLAAATAGTLLLVVRSVDAFADIAVGSIVDNTKSKHGKFRPYLLCGSPLILVACVLCFANPSLPETGKLVYAYCTCLFWSITYTLCDIPYWSLTPAMTSVSSLRTRIVAASRTCAQAGFWIALVGAFPLIQWLDGRDLLGLRVSGWQAVGGMAGLLCAIGFLVTFANVRERETVPRKKRQSPARVFALLIKNAPLRRLLGACFMLETTMSMRAAMAVYYFKYYYGNPGLVPVYMAVYFTPLLAGCMIAPAACRRIGKVTAVRLPIFVSGALTIALWFVRDDAIVMLVFVAIIGLFEGISNIARMSCLADCVEYGQLSCGERDEGAINALNIIKTKLAAGTGGGALIGWLLAAIGFQANQSQDAGTMGALALVFTVVIGAALMLSMLPMRRYALNEARFNEILETLAQHDKHGCETDGG